MQVHTPDVRSSVTDLPGSPGSPKAARLGSPRWLDGRLVLGVLLVLVSVLVGAKVLASAGRSQQAWQATHDLAPGTVLTAGDLELGRVRLFGGADYVLASDAEPVGQVLRRGVGSHELLPARALSPADLVASREISVPVAPGHLPADLAHGQQVDVYVTPADKGGQRGTATRAGDPLAPRLVLSGIPVSSTSAPGGLSSGGSDQPVVLSVGPGQVLALVQAMAQGRVDLVRVPRQQQRVPPQLAGSTR